MPVAEKPNTSDEALMEQVLRGNEQAFEEIMNRYQHRIFNFCLRYLGNEYDAQEVFQETFLRVYSRADRFTPRYRFSTWAYTIARNQCLDRLRTRARRGEQSYEEIAETDPHRLSAALGEGAGDHLPAAGPQKEPDPREKTEQKELEEKIREVMDRLPPAQREVVLLRHFSGLTFPEIAETVGCSVGTAKSRFHFGFKKLSRLLQPLLRET